MILLRMLGYFGVETLRGSVLSQRSRTRSLVQLDGMGRELNALVSRQQHYHFLWSWPCVYYLGHLPFNPRVSSCVRVERATVQCCCGFTCCSHCTATATKPERLLQLWCLVPLSQSTAKHSKSPSFTHVHPFSASRESKVAAATVAREKEKRQPKYIGNLLKQAKMRAVESDRIFDRKLQKEREAQDKVIEGTHHYYCLFL